MIDIVMFMVLVDEEDGGGSGGVGGVFCRRSGVPVLMVTVVLGVNSLAESSTVAQKEDLFSASSRGMWCPRVACPWRSLR